MKNNEVLSTVTSAAWLLRWLTAHLLSSRILGCKYDRLFYKFILKRASGLYHGAHALWVYFSSSVNPLVVVLSRVVQNLIIARTYQDYWQNPKFRVKEISRQSEVRPPDLLIARCHSTGDGYVRRLPLNLLFPRVINIKFTLHCFTKNIRNITLSHSIRTLAFHGLRPRWKMPNVRSHWQPALVQ